MRWTQKQFLIALKAGLDVALIAAGFQTAYLLEVLLGEHDFQAGAAWFGGKLSLIYAALFVVSAQRLRQYENRSSLFNIQEKAGLFRAVFTTSVMFLALNGMFQFSYSAWTLVLTSLVVLVFLGTSRHFLFKHQHQRYLEGKHERKVLIYGAGDAGKLLFKKMYFMEGGDYSLVGFLDDTIAPGTELTIQRARSKARPFTAKVLGGFQDLIQAVRQNNIYLLILAMPSAASSRVMEIVEECKKAKVRYGFVPHLYQHHVEQMDSVNIGDIPLLKKREYYQSFLYRFAKRVFDLAVSTTLLLIFLPLFPLLAILVKRGSPGPVFFRQERAGLNGKLFAMVKFRTMSVAAPVYMPSPASNEPSKYISRIGSFLRDTDLDELPQIWNVLTGDMSIVGPRPEMPFHVEKYNDVQRDRLHVKPGLTGPWQISPDRDKEIHDNIDYDLYYINHQSFFVDLVLVIETALLTAAAIGRKIARFLKLRPAVGATNPLKS